MANKEVQGMSINGLKILCVLSVIGFIASMYIDAGNYFLFSNIDQYNNIDTSKEGIEMIAWMFFGRGVLDVLVLLGIMLMFYKLKIGFNIYVLFQILYVVLPFYLIGKNVNVIVPYELMMINLIYVALFNTQRKHLI